MKLDISSQGLTTLKDVEFPENLTELYCYNNQLTSLEHCPSNVTKLWCNINRLTSLEHCPSSVTELYCCGNQLTSLEHCPSSTTELYCSNNQLTSLEHCPSSITELACYGNQLTSLKHCPSSVTKLWYQGNPLNDEYKNLFLGEIHKLNKKKTFLKGLGIIQRTVQDFKARKIQNAWQRWWYDERNEAGVNRFCKRTVADFNESIKARFATVYSASDLIPTVV